MRVKRKVAALRPELVAYATSLTRNHSEAEGLVQEAIIRALEARSHPLKMEDLRPWMFRVVKNIFIDRQRKERVRREYSDAASRLLSDSTSYSDDPVNALIVRQAFEKLVSRDREILCLIDILGLTYEQAATVIGSPIGTVMSRISRARKAMRENMDETNVYPLMKQKKV